jgi:hypothetical protein
VSRPPVSNACPVVGWTACPRRRLHEKTSLAGHRAGRAGGVRVTVRDGRRVDHHLLESPGRGAHHRKRASAPRGDNKNLIAGSVGTSDLHNGAVTSSAVKDGSATGADLRNATLSINKLDLPQIAFSGPGADPDDFAPHHTAVSSTE